MDVNMKRFLGSLVMMAATVGWAEDYPYCQILDRPEDTVWTVRGGLVTKAAVEAEGIDDLSMADLRAEGGFLYFQTDLGDFNLRGSIESYFFTGADDFDLPSQAGWARAEFEWITRTMGGQAIRLDANPGVYSDWKDLGGEDLFFPFGVSFIQAFNEQASVLAGLEFYPDFRRDFEPRVGLRWSPVETLLIDVFYPESRIMFSPTLEWDIYAGVRFTRDLEYQLDSDDPRKRFIYQENRLYAGVNWAFADDVKLMVQMGRVFDRNVDFRRAQSGADVDDAFFLRVGVGSVL